MLDPEPASPLASEAGTATATAALQARLHAAEAALAQLNRQQEAFAYGVSHDLRAPLRAIEGFAAVLDKRAGLDPEAHDHIARIRAAAVRMSQLIDGLLELSRAGRTEFKSVPVDLSLLAEWAAVELQDAEQQRASSIRIAPDLRVLGDERHLKLLLGKLLHNAWKFSREREQVSIQVSGEHRGERVHVTVADAGCGFDMQYADKMFEPFQRLHGPEQGAGNGLGLAVAQRIVERHGGQLRAESEPGRGSRFHFDLPAAPATGAEPSSGEPR